MDRKTKIWTIILAGVALLGILGWLALENLGVTLPIDQPYSHALLEGLLSGEN